MLSHLCNLFVLLTFISFRKWQFICGGLTQLRQSPWDLKALLHHWGSICKEILTVLSCSWRFCLPNNRLDFLLTYTWFYFHYCNLPLSIDWQSTDEGRAGSFITAWTWRQSLQSWPQFNTWKTTLKHQVGMTSIVEKIKKVKLLFFYCLCSWTQWERCRKGWPSSPSCPLS